MKKLFVFAAAAIFAAALAVSCQEIEVSTDIHHDYRTVTLQLPAPESKVTISEENGKITWIPGDEIVVHGKLVSQMKTIKLTEADISNDGYSATITFDAAGMTPHGDHDYYAQYPASAVHYTSDECKYYCEYNNNHYIQ